MDVYVMPATGGEPKQLTYYPARGPLPPRWGYDNQVYGWTPDGEHVLFRSLRDAGGGSDSFNIPAGTYDYSLSLDGGDGVLHIGGALNHSVVLNDTPNLTLSGVGDESGVEVFCGGLGRTHFIVDIQGYVPFEPLSLPT